MARVQWWWNGKWGALARRDVEIHHQPEMWWVVARSGGAEGHARRYRAESEAAAVALAQRFRQTNERWRAMSDAAGRPGGSSPARDG